MCEQGAKQCLFKEIQPKNIYEIKKYNAIALRVSQYQKYPNKIYKINVGQLMINYLFENL